MQTSNASTSNARNYGSVQGYMRSELAEHRSGLTPFSPEGLAAAYETRIRREARQRESLHGFTIQDLIDLDVVSTTAIITQPLDNPIHPCLDQSRWLTESEPQNKIDLPRLVVEVPGAQGNWCGNNPWIWEHLKPCLQLTSRLMARMAQDPFCDALLNGKRELVPPEDMSAYDRMVLQPEDLEEIHRIHPRQVTATTIRETTNKLNRLYKIIFEPKLRFGFYSPIQGTKLGKRELGACHLFPDNGDLRIMVNVMPLASLFRDDLLDSERLATQWQIATMIYHELFHALHHARWNFSEEGTYITTDNRHQVGIHREPLFANESVIEAGFASENSMFGATFAPFQMQLPLSSMKIRTGLATFMHSWPRRPGFEINARPLLATSEVGLEWKSPVPISFYLSIYSNEFWITHAKRYGILQSMESRSYSKKLDKFVKDPGTDSRKTGFPSDYKGEKALTNRNTLERNLDRYIYLTPEKRLEKIKADIDRDFGVAFKRMETHLKEMQNTKYTTDGNDEDDWLPSLVLLAKGLERQVDLFDATITRLLTREAKEISRTGRASRSHRDMMENYWIELLGYMHRIYGEWPVEHLSDEYAGSVEQRFWKSRLRLRPGASYQDVLDEDVPRADRINRERAEKKDRDESEEESGSE